MVCTPKIATVFNAVIPLVLYTLPFMRTPSGSQGIINGCLHKLIYTSPFVATARTYIGGDHKLCFLSATTTELVTMQVLLLLGSLVSSLMTLVTGKCPPDKGKYSDRVGNRGRPAPSLAC